MIALNKLLQMSDINDGLCVHYCIMDFCEANISLVLIIADVVGLISLHYKNHLKTRILNIQQQFESQLHIQHIYFIGAKTSKYIGITNPKSLDIIIICMLHFVHLFTFL